MGFNGGGGGAIEVLDKDGGTKSSPMTRNI